MKKYFLLLALCLIPCALSTQQVLYVIDNVTVENFDGSQLKGKTIQDYKISRSGSGSKAVTVHSITTGPALSWNTAGVKISKEEYERIQESIRQSRKELELSREELEKTKEEFKKKRQSLLDSLYAVRPSSTTVYIIDGKRVENTSALQGQDPKNIKSITVLSSEAARKTYGADRAIVIETKKGK